MASTHILVVDDEVDLAELVAMNLELEGYRTTLAADGVEALAQVERERPDLVLLDVMMPNLDGWGVLGALQEDPETARLPIMMLTALSGEREVIRGYLSGAVSYLTKPFDLRALMDSVQAALEPLDPEQAAARSRQIRGFLQRLAELETGRQAGPGVRFSHLEAPPSQGPSQADREVLGLLSPRQHQVAAMLGGGWDARQIASTLGTSRSNVYATRKRIARHLGVGPHEVADEARRLGLAVDPPG